MEDSIRLVSRLVELGFKKLITTPHIFYEHYPNTPENILAGLNQLKAALNQAGIDVEIEAAAEYFLDDYFEDLLKKDAPLLTFGDRNILVEVSTMAEFRNLPELIFSLRTKGYFPILAHPERYIYYTDRFDFFEQIKAMGCAYQVNLLSLAGHYGSAQRKLGVKLLNEQMVDFLGTDLHQESHIKKLIDLYNDQKMYRLIKSASLKNQNL